MFFSKNKNTGDSTPAANEPKKRSTFGLLFNPQIGESIKPLAETTNVFVQLIAMVFAMNGLFPKNHPALTGEPGAKLSLSLIIRTAWRDLSFTKAGAPKVALFLAVTGTLILAAISMVTALLAGFMGTAHAQTATGNSGGFFSPAGSDDLAQNWLDYIFKGQPLSHYYSQNGQPIPQTVNIQCAMIAALGFYSNAMLIFAAFILAYHLVSMIVNTAHEGVAMGKKANQVWAPIRLVVAIGLLIPMGGSGASCPSGSTGAGLNAGQYIVIQMASWGSGLASQTWTKFVSTLANAQNKFIQPTAPDVNGVVTDIVTMEACKWAWNYHLCLAGASSSGGDSTQCNTATPTVPSQFANEAMQGPTQYFSDPNSGDVSYRYTTVNQIKSSKFNVCGSFTIPGAIEANSSSPSVGSTIAQNDGTASIAQQLSSVQQSTFKQFQSQFATVGATIGQLIPTYNDGPITDNTSLATLVNQYQTTLKTNLDAALNQQAAGNSNLQVDTITDIGWAGAGAWLNTIARDQGDIISAYENGLPRTVPPDLKEMTSIDSPSQPGVATLTAQYLSNFGTWMQSDYAINCGLQEAASAGGSASTGMTDTSGVGAPPASDATSNAAIHSLDLYIKTKLQELGKQGGDGESTLNVITDIIDKQASQSGVWQSAPSSCTLGNNPQYFTLGAQLVTANPLAEFSFWGFANLRTAYSLWKNIFAWSKAGIAMNIEFETRRFAESAQGHYLEIQSLGLKQKFIEFVASILSFISLLFFICGYTVAFIVPLLPFFRFFFNVLTWVVSLLEAVVAVPLIALAHLNPEGEGLPGQSAKAAYFMVFNVFLRPVLTVFGLVAGLVVFYVAIMLLNITFSVAVAGTNAGYHFGIETLVRIAYTLMYGATVYVCANNAFKTIGFFPEHALRWIGQTAHHERMGDGGRAVQGVMGQAQGYLGEKAVGLVKLKPPN